MKKSLLDLTNVYKLTKTLKFGLKPIGATLETFKRNNVLENDEKLADEYQKMKGTIDKYHQYFINDKLASFTFDNDLLREYKEMIDSGVKKGTSEYKKFMKIQKDLRKSLNVYFKSDENFKLMFKKDLFITLLPSFIAECKEELYYTNSFDRFSTYFTNYNQIRENLYTDKEISSSIPFRLVHDNLPKFNFNTIVLSKLPQELVDEFEDIHGIDLMDYSHIEAFNLVITQMGIDAYNTFIGGYSEENGKKVKGLNEIINLYNQRVEKNDRIAKLKPLYKQILSDKVSYSFLPKKLENSNDVLKSLYDYHHENLLNNSLLSSFESMFTNLSKYDLSKVYLDSKQFTNLSQWMFGRYDVITSAFKYLYSTTVDVKFEKKVLDDSIKGRTTNIDKLKKYIKSFSYLSLVKLQEILDSYIDNNVTDLVKTSVVDTLQSKFSININDKDILLTNNIIDKYNAIKGIVTTDYEGRLFTNRSHVEQINNYYTSIQELRYFIKMFRIDDTVVEFDSNFYDLYNTLYSDIILSENVYNLFRNYATQKLYSTDKVKLNFGSQKLLAGWSKNKLNEYSHFLMRKDGLYYFGIMTNEKNSFVVDKLVNKNDIQSDSYYESIIIDFMGDVNKQLPRMAFSDTNKNIRSVFDKMNKTDISELNDRFKKLKKKIQDNKDEVSDSDKKLFVDLSFKLAKYYLYFVNNYTEYKNTYDLHKLKESYESIDALFEDLNKISYKMEFNKVAVDDVDLMVDNGYIYLYQIYNTDYNRSNKSGNKKLNTIYFEELFSDENMGELKYRLMGEGEMFYRKASIKDSNIVVHKAGDVVDNKNPLNPNKKHTFKYDVVKDKRFTVDTFHLHLPISINAKLIDGNKIKINDRVNDIIRDSDDVNVIGIDRGERNLLYISVRNQQGELLEPIKSYNLVESKNSYYKNVVDYHKLLTTREGDKMKGKANLVYDTTIKEIKEGYLSQIVHEVVNLVLKHNAIIVMEDLNGGFKNSRKHIEKSLYQKFEKALITKLNYLVIKGKDKFEVGGSMNGLQMTNMFESFQKMTKQNGIIFYVNPQYTSNIDPLTGFVSDVVTRDISTTEQLFNFFRQFDSISYNPLKKVYEFAFDYAKMKTRLKHDNEYGDIQILNTYGSRIVSNRSVDVNNNFVYVTYDLTNEMDKFCEKYDLNTDNILDGVLANGSKEVLSNLFKIVKMMLQMRNSNPNTNEDYMISPLCVDGINFDTRNSIYNIPDADANGAYNIATKGIIKIEQIKNDTFDMTISTYINKVKGLHTMNVELA